MIQCPTCKTRFDASDDTFGSTPSEVVCPACMNSFIPPTQDNISPPAHLNEDLPQPTGAHYQVYTETRRYDIQSVEGGILAGLSRFAIREAIYTGKLNNTARLRKLDGSWEPIGSVAEFAAVFQLLGAEPLPGPATRKIAGWKGERTGEAPNQPSAPAPSAPHSTPTPPPENGPRPFENPKPTGISPALLIGGAALFGILLVGGVLLVLF